MRLGLFMMPVHPAASGDRTIRSPRTIEKSLLADRLGFDEMFLGEHFSARPSRSLAADVHGEPYSANQESRFRHRRHLTAQSPSRHHRRRGRAIRPDEPRPLHPRHRHGSLLSDFELLGNDDPAQRNRMLVESIDMIEKIWSSDPPYDIKGEFWSTQVQRQ